MTGEIVKTHLPAPASHYTCLEELNMSIDAIKETLRDLEISEAWMPHVFGHLVEVAESWWLKARSW